MKLEQVASLVSGTLAGEGAAEISGARGVENAREGDITFLMHNKYLEALKNKMWKTNYLSEFFYSKDYNSAKNHQTGTKLELDL